MRLSKQIKEEILGTAVNSIMKDRIDKRDKAWTNFADEIYRHAVGPNKLPMAALPDGFLPKAKTVAFYVETGDGLSSKRAELRMSEERRIPCSLLVAYGYTGASQFTVCAGTTLQKKYELLKKESEQIGKDSRAIYVKIKGVLEACTTDKALIEAWPEATRYMPPEIKQHKALPAIAADGLNELIAKVKAA